MENKRFVEEINSHLFINSSLNKVKFDYAWVDIYEEVIPYIDNILRNPKRFIVNEEEIVKVELAKKITVESVIHLTQHTNLIQDIDDNGDVKPSKILNINKEESFDTYENRFIYTLINNMNLFYNTRVAEGFGNSFVDAKKSYVYDGNSVIGGKNYNISINFTNHERNNIDSKGKKSNTTIEDRLKKIKQQIDSFTCSELYQILNKLHVPAVRSPIRKTNVILKNPNFQKANELWNYIQSYTGSGVSRNKEKKNYINNGKLKKKYDQIFFDTYMSALSDTSDVKTTKREAISNNITKLIENIYSIDESIGENELKKMFSQHLKSAKRKNIKTREEIIDILKNCISYDNSQIHMACSILDEDRR